MIFLYTTVPTKEVAEKLSDEAIDKNLAACVDMWPIQSKYMWEGKKVSVEQYMVMFTTHSSLATQLETYIVLGHPNNIPLVARTEIDIINNAYQEWVSATLGL
jgi:periplasmic divalent cation tolerance protein